jgi:hypothetical protein
VHNSTFHSACRAVQSVHNSTFHSACRTVQCGIRPYKTLDSTSISVHSIYRTELCCLASMNCPKRPLQVQHTAILTLERWKLLENRSFFLFTFLTVDCTRRRRQIESLSSCKIVISIVRVTNVQCVRYDIVMVKSHRRLVQ